MVRICNILVLLLAFSASVWANTGQVVSYSLVRSFPKEELTAFFKAHNIPKLILPVIDGIDVYEVIYTTLYADSSIVKASGLLYLPHAVHKELPLMIYDHGTTICRDRATNFTGEQSICLAFATDGYVVAAPDYVGMGRGERDQLYLDAFTESHASVDMLLASKHILSLLEAKTSDKLFVTGYSQGGHAAMATTHLLQTEYADQFKVTAASPMSGPYDLESMVYDGRTGSYDYPVFLMMLLRTYYICQGDVSKLSTALCEPYCNIVPPLMDGEYTFNQINATLPDTVFKVLNTAFYADYDTNPNSSFKAFLKRNNVYDWKPEMPMQLCYCNGDEEVTYKNSITAFNTMQKNGAKKVELWRSGKKFGHVNCALFSVIYTKMYFDGFMQGRPGSHGPRFTRMLVNIGKLAVPAR